MTTEIAQRREEVTPEEAARMTRSWPALLDSQIRTAEQAAMISAAVKRLTAPVTRKWMAGRVATLLSHYYVSSVSADMMAAIADDWHAELRKYPAWAILNACRWWMSEDNDKRRQRPLPGDIAARARHEMGPVKVAEHALRRFESGKAHPVRPVEVHHADDGARSGDTRPIREIIDEYLNREAAG